MLYLVGLGLGDPSDVTVKGLEIIKMADRVFLENYTSILTCGQTELEKYYGRSLTLVDREMMEQGCEEILTAAKSGNAAVLVVGDPLNATTHTDLILRAVKEGIQYRVVHNASIINAVACCGLQIYNFGETVSIPFWTDTWQPESFYDKISKNRRNGLHTLCLLDIKVKELNLKMLVEGKTVYDEPRFMTVNQAAEQLLSIIKKRTSDSNLKPEEEEGAPAGSVSTDEFDLEEKTIVLGLSRVGSSSQQVVKTTLDSITKVDLGGPLHSLVIPGKLHPLEEEMIDLFSD